jgi:hypothetical protein
VSPPKKPPMPHTNRPKLNLSLTDSGRTARLIRDALSTSPSAEGRGSETTLPLPSQPGVRSVWSRVGPVTYE